MSSRSTPNKPGSTGRLTTKKGSPSLALTQSPFFVAEEAFLC